MNKQLFFVRRWQSDTNNRYTGLDIALTKNGWCMVEGNARGQFVGWQIPLQKRFRKEIEHYLKMR